MRFKDVLPDCGRDLDAIILANQQALALRREEITLKQFTYSVFPNDAAINRLNAAGQENLLQLFLTASDASLIDLPLAGAATLYGLLGIDLQPAMENAKQRWGF